MAVFEICKPAAGMQKGEQGLTATCDEGLPEHHVFFIHSQVDRGGHVEGQVGGHAGQLLAHTRLPGTRRSPLCACLVLVVVTGRHVSSHVYLQTSSLLTGCSHVMETRSNNGVGSHDRVSSNDAVTLWTEVK